jgi:hypothetical protein
MIGQSLPGSISNMAIEATGFELQPMPFTCLYL